MGKQVVGERLATAGMNVAYGDESFPSQGPIGQLGANFPNGDYSLTYDQPFTYDDSELSGFFFCCGQPGVCRNSLRTADWPAIDKESVKVDLASMNIRIGARTCANEGEISIAGLPLEGDAHSDSGLGSPHLRGRRSLPAFSASLLG